MNGKFATLVLKHGRNGDLCHTTLFKHMHALTQCVSAYMCADFYSYVA